MSELSPDATVADVIRAAILASVVRLRDHEDGARRGSDPEDVHQARVAARRLRSDLRTFHGFCDEAWVQDLRGELRWLGTELGAVRDIEVMLMRLRDGARTLPPPQEEAAERVLRRLQADWEAARAELTAALASQRYASLRARLDRAAFMPALNERANERARDALPPVVLKQWRRLERAVDSLGEHPSDAALHEVRIRAKRARYAAEAVAPVFGKRARRFAKKLAAVQDVLGEHQDAVVAQAWLAKTAHECSAPEAFAAGMLAAREAAAAAAARAAFPAIWDEARDERLWSWL